jgi:hypothetical protein
MANWISVAIGVIGILFGVYERRQRTKVQNIGRDILRRLAGEVKVVFSNANWADMHYRNIGYLFAQPAPDLVKIRTEAFDGARDAAACARQLGLTHSQIRGIQGTLFNDAEETLPEIQADDVKAARLQNKSDGTPQAENKNK